MSFCKLGGTDGLMLMATGKREKFSFDTSYKTCGSNGVEEAMSCGKRSWILESVFGLSKALCYLTW